MSKETLYLGGPMTGRPQFNFPAFDRAAARLREHGYTIVSPAELDDPETREAALASPDGAPGTGSHSGQTWADFLARDVKLIADKVTGIVLLDGWEESRGARLECFVARLEGKPIYLYRPEAPGLRVPLPTEALVHAFTANGLVTEALFDSEDGTGIPVKVQRGEVRITSETGGQKGRKPERLDLVPPEPLWELARVYGFGSEKYDDHNYLKGYDWSLSYGALLRHVTQSLNGEELDNESGLDHLAHAAWHCFALIMFKRHNLGTDDRIANVVAKPETTTRTARSEAVRTKTTTITPGEESA